MTEALLAKLYINSLVARKRETYEGTLEPFGRKVYSQTDEDGILEEILYRLELSSSLINFVEFGVGAGTENNTLKLLGEGAKGVWVEGDKTKAEQCMQLTKSFIEDQQLLVINTMASTGNLPVLVRQIADFLGTDVIDVLSIDIDGPDYELIQCMLSDDLLTPQVIVCEYNGRFGPTIVADDDYCRLPATKKIPREYLYGTGSSLAKWVNLLCEYKLVACGILGINAFFVRNEKHNSYKFPNSNIKEMYNPLELQPWLQGGFKQMHGFPSRFSIYN
jgi:hypothetical protein